jgi:hypothetical protein
MDAPSIAVWSDFRREGGAQSLFIERSGRVLLSGHCKADWFQQQSQTPGIDKVFVPTGLAAAVPNNVRSVVCAGGENPTMLTTDGKLFAAGYNVVTRVRKQTIRFLSNDGDVLLAATDDGGIYLWTTDWKKRDIPKTPARQKKGDLGRVRA